MNLIYRNPGLQHSIDSILAFQSEKESRYWMEPIYLFYPEIIERKYAESLSHQGRIEYLSNCVKKIYQQHEPVLAQKVDAYNAHWRKYCGQISEALSESFDIDCTKQFNNMVGNVTLNPICPRYLQKQSFDIFFFNSERGALGLAIHEIIHFVWFTVWKSHFRDTWEEYERPHLKWILSEMVVEPIMRDERLSSINPYFHDGCVYDYFYTMKIDGNPILDTLYKMYQQMDIHTFMEESYRFCQEHEQIIRTHIAALEEMGNG